MGWVPATAYRIGAGAVNDPIAVDEPAGYEGERVTPSGQIKSKAGPFTIERRGRTVYATRIEAVENKGGD